MAQSYAQAKGRSSSKRDKKHVRIYVTMLDSPAWLSLSAHAQCVYIRIKQRYKGKETDNNGQIPLSVREAGQYCHVSKNTGSKAIDELIDKGFIKVGIDSSFANKIGRSRRWILTDEPYKGKPPTNEWRDWKNE